MTMTPEQLRESYPTIARMADAALNETVGYQKYALEGEASKLFIAHAAALEEIERLNAAWKAQQFHLEAEERESAHWQERAEKAERRAERLKGHADDGPPLTPHGEAIAAGDGTLHGAIDYWQEQAFTMAAGQCCVKSGGLMADDHGNAYCDMQRQRDELRGRLRVMTNIMGDALSVLNTIQGEESDEETRLDSLRAKMAGAIDSVLRTEKASIYKEKT